MVSKSGEIRALKAIFSLDSRKEMPGFEQRLETSPACGPCFFRSELVSGSLELESLAVTETNCILRSPQKTKAPLHVSLFQGLGHMALVWDPGDSFVFTDL